MYGNIITMRKKIYPVRKDIRFPPELLKKGEKMADAQNITFNQLIRDLLSRAVRIKEITDGMK